LAGFGSTGDKDGTVIETITVEAGGKEYHGRFRIIRVDRFKPAFEIDYGMERHRHEPVLPQ
jgi:hypothetical protein